MSEPIPNRYYRHYKGGLYCVLMLAKDSNTTESVVVYRSLKDKQIWVRSAREWASQVEIWRVMDEFPVVTDRFSLLDPRDEPQ